MRDIKNKMAFECSWYSGRGKEDVDGEQNASSWRYARNEITSKRRYVCARVSNERSGSSRSSLCAAYTAFCCIEICAIPSPHRCHLGPMRIKNIKLRRLLLFQKMFVLIKEATQFQCSAWRFYTDSYIR